MNMGAWGDIHIVWDLDDDPDGNVQHIAEHGISVDEVQEVLFGLHNETTISKSSGNKITFGYTGAGRYLAVVWEHIMDDPLTMRPITAYEVPPPRARRR